MRTPFAIRLAQALAASEKGEGEIAREAGVSPGQLSRWKNATADEGPVPLATAIAGLLRAMPRLNGHWLVTGEGDMHLPSGDEILRLHVVGRIADGEIAGPILSLLARPSSPEAIGDALAAFLAEQAKKAAAQ